LILKDDFVTPICTQDVISFDRWAYAAATSERDFLRIYFEKGAYVKRGDIPVERAFPGFGPIPNTPRDGITTIRQFLPTQLVMFSGFDPRSGVWRDVGVGTLKTNFN
jgi:hypothetical protein